MRGLPPLFRRFGTFFLFGLAGCAHRGSTSPSLPPAPPTQTSMPTAWSPPKPKPPPLEPLGDPPKPEPELFKLGQKNNNIELEMLVKADQADRRLPLNELMKIWPRIHAEDTIRRRRVSEIMAAGGAQTASDYYAAALVYQHGETLEHYALARGYAFEAAKRGHPGGAALAAKAWDRWLVAAGYPQRFGTQFQCDPKCRLQPFDASVTDAERARWGVEALETLKHRYDDYNANLQP